MVKAASPFFEMYFPSLAPKKSDTNTVLWNKAVQLLNLLNSGVTSQPTFYPEGSVPKLLDTEHKLIQKAVGATYVYSGKA